jgi:predicted Na+-dependent transporter
MVYKQLFNRYITVINLLTVSKQMVNSIATNNSIVIIIRIVINNIRYLITYLINKLCY